MAICLFSNVFSDIVVNELDDIKKFCPLPCQNKNMSTRKISFQWLEEQGSNHTLKSKWVMVIEARLPCWLPSGQQVSPQR